MQSVNPSPLAEIEEACRLLDIERSSFEAMIATLEEDLAIVRAKHLTPLKRQAKVVARRQSAVVTLVENNEGVFVKPKTLVLHGTKVGYVNAKGELDFADEELVVNAIRSRLKDRFDELVRTKHSLNKNVVRALPANDLARIGCTISGAGDQVLVQQVDGDVQKMFDKLIEHLVDALSSAED